MMTDAEALKVLDPIAGQFENPDVVASTQNIGGLLTMFIGPRGGGKTTAGVWFVQDSKQNYPTVPRVANVPIENAVYVPNLLILLATKLILEGGAKPYELNPDGTVHIVPIPPEKQPKRMQVILDEAAISGFESRGSGSFNLNSYLLALSRKLNIDLFLVSQLMSMVEKRGQWLSDYYWLCQGERPYGWLEGFEYQIYDENFRKTNTYTLDVGFAKQHLFPKFNTNDIPNYDELAAGFQSQFGITEDDIQFYLDIIAGKPHPIQKQVEPREITILEKKSLRGRRGRWAGQTFLMDGKRYEILQADWNFDKGAWQYRCMEIPNLAYADATGESLSENAIVEEGDV